MRFQLLFAIVLAALTTAAPSVPEGVVSVAAMKEWLSTTDAELTFTGLPVEELGINPLTTTVTFCSTRTANLCSGPCTVFTGAGVCINTPNTRCLAATTNVAFCDRSNCGGQLQHAEHLRHAPGQWVLLHPRHRLDLDSLGGIY
ncbi:hypothetical protein B0H14DRAFT_3870668 [Mycena olivaceomarginata]|nr:hypothetical protein B0H14DRAFT_3870668 [Mycena olivaceomarginata]